MIVILWYGNRTQGLSAAQDLLRLSYRLSTGYAKAGGSMTLVGENVESLRAK